MKNRRNHSVDAASFPLEGKQYNMHLKLLPAAALAALLATHSPNSEARIARGACSMSFDDSNSLFLGARGGSGRFDFAVSYQPRTGAVVYATHVDVQFTYNRGFTRVRNGGNNKFKFRWSGARDLTKNWVPHNRGYRRYTINKHMSRTTHPVDATWDLSGQRDRSCFTPITTH